MKLNPPILTVGSPANPPGSPLFCLRSHLEKTYQDELEGLFFFNPRQFKVQDQVLHSVAQYGLPEIQAIGQSITLGLKNFPGAQTLFILDGNRPAQLLGTLVYVREKDRLLVLYLALKPSFTNAWQSSCALLVFITQALREIALRISGVNAIEFRVGTRPSLMRIH